MSLKKYITESERATAFPVTGDVLRVVVNEYSENEIAIDFPVVEHTDNSIVFESDEYAYGILEGCNYVGDNTDGDIDPPSEELDEGMGSKCCKYCGDEIYKPTTDCGYDSQDPDGENWEVIDIDGDGDADIAISNEGYRSITNEGTLMERIKDGKIYCPEACCGTKVMDCTCGAKCPHCNCKQIQKLAGEVKMFEDQALLYRRMGVPASADYYTRKLTEALDQTQKLIEDVEDTEAMITRRIMNHPEFSDMVREYGIEQITQAIADTAEFHGDDDDEIGSSDVSAMVNDTIKSLRRMIEGYYVLPKMDRDKYQQRDGLEGPMMTKSGKVLYYDPKEGKHYDPDTDMYMDYEDAKALDEKMDEAEYQGRKVKLGKPMQGDIKKFKVYVKDPKTGNVKKVNFGHGGSSVKGKAMKIRKNNPAARKSFRARHNCDNPGPRTKARYWSCRKW